MTTFSELNIGDRFHFGIDADGHEPYMWKVSATEGYIEHGSGSGSRETVSGDTEIYTWSTPITLSAYPTDIERAALTMLTDSHGNAFANHWALSSYVRTLATNPDEIRDLDDYILDEQIDGRPMNELLIEDGFIAPRKRFDDHSTWKAIADERPKSIRAQTREARRALERDRAMLFLCEGIRRYRIAGRPMGDYQTGSISGMGSTIATVTSSLAAAVAEYHETIINIYISDLYDVVDAASDNLPLDLITQSEAAAIAGISPQAINNAIRDRRIRAYSDIDAISHKPGDRRVSRADIDRLWPKP